MSVTNRFRPARTIREYGYDVNYQLIRQTGTPSGFLLPWEAIDAEAAAVSRQEPCEYVVTGETVTDDGVRFAELGVSPTWMEHQDFVRTGRQDWHRPGIDCEKLRHEHRVPA